MLLIDHYLPRYHFALVHASRLRAPPEPCYRVARGLDLLRHPVVRTLLVPRSLPQRLAHGLVGHSDAAAADTPPRIGPAPFAACDRPGFAKIAFNLRVAPYGSTSSILTMETRVALTDPQSV